MDESMQLKRRVAPSFSENNPYSDKSSELQDVKLSKADIAVFEKNQNPKISKATHQVLAKVADLFVKSGKELPREPDVRMA